MIKEMTREERLYSMRMQDLKVVADKLGIKINVKAAKSIAVQKVLEAEAAIAAEEQKIEPAVEAEPEVEPEVKAEPKPEAEIKTSALASKRGQLIEYKGKAQNICAWAKELGKSANTLYGRIYKLGWPVEKAFEK